MPVLLRPPSHWPPPQAGFDTQINFEPKINLKFKFLLGESHSQTTAIAPHTHTTLFTPTQVALLPAAFRACAPPFAVEMARRRSEYVHVPLLDWLMTLGFLLLSASLARSLLRAGEAALFCIALLTAHAMVGRLREGADVFASWCGARAAARGMVSANPFASPLQRKKFADQAWQLAVHVVFALAEAHILSEEPWWYETQSSWLPSVEALAALPVRTDLKVLYLAQLVVWVYTCAAHRYLDERRRDYYVLYAHHLVTILLVLGSWEAGGTAVRIGLLVLYVHDASDVFIDLLKMVNYSKLEGARGFYASEIAYVAAIVSWGWFRFYQYPARVLKVAIVEAFRVRGPPPPGDGTLVSALAQPLPVLLDYYATVRASVGIPVWPFGKYMLLFLLALHIYWGYMLAMVGYRILTESAREASRQEYEGASDDEQDDGSGGGGDGGGRAAPGDGANSGSSRAATAAAAVVARAGAEAAPQRPTRAAANAAAAAADAVASDAERTRSKHGRRRG